MEKKIRLTGGLAIFLLACLIITPATAAWPSGYDYNGFDLTTQESGTFEGTIYCDAGNHHGLGWVPYTVGYSSIPTGTVKWAYLLTGVWGGTETYTGWASITVTNNSGTYELSNETLDCSNDGSNMSANTSCSGNGKYMIVNDVTDYLDISTFSATANTGGTYIDGRVYGIVLIAAIEDSTKNATAYWLNAGNVNLHCKINNQENNNALTEMTGTSYSSAVAKLYAMQYVGTSGENDYLYFNAPSGASSPRTLTNIAWDRASYAKYLLNSDNDLADCSQGSYFDLDVLTESYDDTQLSDLVNLVGDNEVLFWRGHDDDADGEIESSFNSSGIEGEAYVSPMMALLVLDDIWRTYDFSSETPGTAGSSLVAYESDAFDGTLNDVDYVDDEFGSYTEIEEQDVSDYETQGDSAYAAHRFKFGIDETSAVSLDITWYGEVSDGDAEMYIWNGSSYVQVDSGSEPLTWTTSSPGSYINSGAVNVLLIADTEDETLSTDYIVLKAVPDV